MTIYPAESIAVPANAVRRHGVVCQVGTQIHQSANYRHVVDWVHQEGSGQSGASRRSGDGTWGTTASEPRPQEEPVPEGIDFDLYCGPAPLREFNRLLVRDAAMHCSFWDYSAGGAPAWHTTWLTCRSGRWTSACPRKSHPSAAATSLAATAMHQHTDILWQYPNLTMRFRHFSQFNHQASRFGNVARTAFGIYFHGLNGTLHATTTNDRSSRRILNSIPPTSRPHSSPPAWCTVRSLKCIRKGGQPSCSPLYHIKVDLPLTLGNLSYKLGRTINLDPADESIVGDPEAAKLAIPIYREPWRFPTQYLTA